MIDPDLEQSRARLGVPPGASAEVLQKAYLQKSFALIKAGASDAEREELRAAHAALAGDLQRRESTGRAPTVAELAAPEPGPIQYHPPEPAPNPYDPCSFESWRINLVAPPVVVLFAILIQRSPLGFFLQGFHVWVHEFGHATVAWLTGRRALPLPFGWTSIGAEKSLFVYFGILFLLTVLFVAGARERKIWPMLLAIGIGVVQAYMTWRLPEERARMWFSFGGIGGEFYLAAAMMALFYVQLPEKFKWGGCRYPVLFICAASFSETYAFWKKVKRGAEGIPYGTLIHGEEDQGGDMNILHDDFGWTQRDIIHTYNHLADACVIALVVIYLIFALRLDALARRLLAAGMAGRTARS